MWSFDLRMTADGFRWVDSTSGDVRWHRETFDDFDRAEVESWAKSFSEVQGLHVLIRRDPDWFFGARIPVWGYSGTVGRAPDFVGVGPENRLHIAEVKWQDGWHRRLASQVRTYAEEFWFHGQGEHYLTVHVACTQGARRALLADLSRIPAESFAWRAVDIRFGFVQLGWEIARPNVFYLRTLWFDSAAWNGHDLGSGSEQQVLLY